MITEREFQALLQLINRIPMTIPEQLWIQALLERLRTLVKPEKKEEEDE